MTHSPSLRPALEPTRPARGFIHDLRGVAAVEFAIIVPVMALLYLGVLEVSMGYQASRRVALVSRTLADLTAQAEDKADPTPDIAATEINDIHAASNWILAPFPTSGQLRTTISSVVFKGTAASPTAFVDWSVGLEGVKRSCAQLTIVASTASPSLTTIPQGVVTPGTTIIVADIAYDYKPLLSGSFRSIGAGSVSQITIKQSSYMRPRNATKLTLAGGVGGATYCNVAFP